MKSIILSILILFGIIPNIKAADHFVVNSADSGSNSLRDAVANSSANDVIYFDVIDTIKLTTGVINIDHNLTIIGTGYPIISGENLSRIFNLTSGTLNMEDVTLVKGRVTSGNGGGAIYLAGGNVTLKRCKFFDNVCSNATNLWGGGALSSASGTLWIEECHFENNSVSGGAAGGAINNHSTMTLYRCTVNDNSASGGSWKYGGGINAYGNTYIYYSTISGNTISTGSSSAYGAGVSKAWPGTLIIKNSTITHNEILNGGDNGGGVFSWGSTTIENNIIAENFNSTGGNSDIFSSTSTTSGGYNIIQQAVSGFNLVSTDIQTSPVLGVFANHGGNTPSFAIGCNSPAYNAGNDLVADSMDQRGVNSISNGQRDIGAYEFNGAIPNPSVNTTAITCSGGSDGSASVASATLGATYNWSNGGSGLSISGLSAGQYTLTETYSNGCPGSVVFDLIDPIAIVANPSVTSTTCTYTNDGSITLAPTGGSSGYTYDWDIDGTGDFDDNQNLTSLSPANYSVVVKDGNGCLSASTLVSVGTPVAVSYSVNDIDPSCNGLSDGSITISSTQGGTTPYTYSFNSGSYTNQTSYTGLAGGSYLVAVKDNNGCTAGSNITLNNPAQVTNNSSSQDVTCFGENDGSVTITATGGTGNLQYSIDGVNYQSSFHFDNQSPNTYTTYVKDVNDCEATSSIVINEPTEIIITGVVTDDSGSGDGAIDVSVTGGSGSYTYLWDDISSSTTQDLTNLAGGNYEIIVSDATCAETKSFNVGGGVTGVEVYDLSIIELYPNPFIDEVTIISNGIETISLSVFNLDGVSVFDGIINESSVFQLDLSPGVYYFRMKYSNQILTKRMVKM